MLLELSLMNADIHSRCSRTPSGRLEGGSVGQALAEMAKLESLITAGDAKRAELTVVRDSLIRQLESARQELESAETALGVRAATLARIESEIQAAHTDFIKSIRQPKSNVTEMPIRPQRTNQEGADDHGQGANNNAA